MRRLPQAIAAAALLVAASLAFAAPALAATRWSEQDSGLTTALNSVEFVTATDGLAVGNDGVALATDDGGDTWTAVDAGTSVDLYAVMGFDDLCGDGGTQDCWWVAGAGGTILFSDDSGATWCEQETGTTETIRDLGNVGPNDIFAAGTNGLFLRTTSGGQMCGAAADYTAGSTGTTADLHGVTSNLGGGWTAVGEDGTIVRSTSQTAGEPADSPTDVDLFGITANCGGDCREIAVGAEGTVLRSIDGADFTAMSADGDATLRSVSMPIDEMTVLVAGDSGTIVGSSDGGDTWAPQSTPNCADLMGISAPPAAADAWAVGTIGTILTNTSTGGGDQPKCGPAYRMVAGDGGIFTFGDRNFWGSTGDIQLNQPIVGGATRGSDFDGYWIVARDGGVFAFNAEFHGSLANEVLSAPAIAIEPTPTGEGYWIALEDGTIRGFGDAGDFGDMSAETLNEPIIGMSVTPSGQGYWLVARDGGIFSFGDAAFHGSMGDQRLNAEVIDLGPTPDGNGYYLLGADGGVFSFGTAVFHGSTGDMQLNEPVVAMLVREDGYWFTAADGGVFTFGDLEFLGSMGAVQLNAPVLEMMD